MSFSPHYLSARTLVQDYLDDHSREPSPVSSARLLRLLCAAVEEAENLRSRSVSTGVESSEGSSSAKQFCSRGFSVVSAGGSVRRSGEVHSPADARALAACLLEAADHAEGEL